MKCSVEGCERPILVKVRGLCENHYRKLIRNPATPRLKGNNRCRVDGCTRKYHCSGYCAFHYKRFLVHGDPLVCLVARTWEEKVARCKRDVQTGCLLWAAAGDKDDYGVTSENGRHMRAHRVSLEKKLGRPLLPGMQACHTCDRPNCIEPEHLFEGTPSENTRDMWSKGRQNKKIGLKGTENFQAKLTEEDVKVIRFLGENNVGTREFIADVFFDTTGKRISRRLVGMIIGRQRWGHVP